MKINIVLKYITFIRKDGELTEEVWVERAYFNRKKAEKYAKSQNKYFKRQNLYTFHVIELPIRDYKDFPVLDLIGFKIC